jgi:predicted permease
VRPLDKLRLRLRSLFARDRVDAELRAELDFHLAEQTAELVASGMDPRRAREAALRALGDLTRFEEECRDMRQTRWLETFLQDLRYGLRSLRLSPLFTVMATLSLALGIGANTAIFSFTDALLLRQLPVHDPGRLVAVGDPARTHSLSSGSVRSDLFSVPMYRELRDRNDVFSGLYASGRGGRIAVGIEGAAKPETARGRFVSGNFFAVLGVPALRGRTLTADDDRAPGASPYVVISHDYWARRFGNDPGIVGRSLTLNDHRFTIVGVTGPGFFGDVVGTSADLWAPLSMQPQLNPGRDFLDRWDRNFLLLMGRLKPGVTLPQAATAIDALFARVVETRAGGAIDPLLVSPYASDPTALHVQVGPGGAGFSSLRPQFAKPLPTLMAIVALVLLIACVNIANLLLERATGRQKEISVRLALGAGRGRLLRQLLTESLVLALLGGALGVLFAYWADVGLLHLVGIQGSPAFDLRPNPLVLAFTAGVALLTAFVFGLAPALRATRVELAPALRERSRSLAGVHPRRWPLGKVLVVVQFALSLLLLVGAGLFGRTLINLQRLDLGFDRRGLLMLQVDPIGSGHTQEQVAPLLTELTARLRALPGVQRVSFSENGIFSGTESRTSIAFVGRPPLADGADDVDYDQVGPDYFASVGIPIRRGRGISADDRPGTPRVAVVNEAMASFYFPGEDPIGKRFVDTDVPDVVYEIVGVAGDARDHDLRNAVARRYYYSALQNGADLSAVNFEIRGARPAALAEPVRAAVQAFDPRLTILDLAPLTLNIDGSIRDEHLVAKLSAVFGLLALVLAAIGLYGVVSHAVARRTGEIGIRVALGAGHRRVLWMVLRETLALALAGIAVGLPGALISARVVSSRLFGLSTHDVPTLAAATGILVAVALVAGAVPGSRAARLDPTEALREE